MYKNAMVIGKFYPPHAGHAHLIATAAAQAERVSVLVLGSRFESVDVAERTRWLEEEFSGHAGVQVIGMRNDCPEDYGVRRDLESPKRADAPCPEDPRRRCH